MISVTVPAPKVRPPSRMANRRPLSMALGVISSTASATLSPLLLRQDVHLRRELRVRRDARGLAHHLPPLHLVLLRPPQQQPDVVPRHPLVQKIGRASCRERV